MTEQILKQAKSHTRITYDKKDSKHESAIQSTSLHPDKKRLDVKVRVCAGHLDDFEVIAPSKWSL